MIKCPDSEAGADAVSWPQEFAKPLPNATAGFVPAFQIGRFATIVMVEVLPLPRSPVSDGVNFMTMLPGELPETVLEE